MPEPQEYTIASWSPWIDKVTGQPITDPHNNVKGSVLFEEDRAEPIDATFKPPVEIGQKKYGVVDLYQTKAGSIRKGFQRRDKPQAVYPAQAGQITQGKYPRSDEHTQESIARSVALKAAVDHYPTVTTSKISVIDIADQFLAWLQGVEQPTTTAPATGYDKARAVAQNLRRDEREEDAELRSMMNNQPDDTNDDIPY